MTKLVGFQNGVRVYSDLPLHEFMEAAKPRDFVSVADARTFAGTAMTWTLDNGGLARPVTGYAGTLTIKCQYCGCKENAYASHCSHCGAPVE